MGYNTPEYIYMQIPKLHLEIQTKEVSSTRNGRIFSFKIS